MPEVVGFSGIGGTGWWEAGRIGCLVTKVLIPFVERTVGPEAGAALVRAAGHPRDYLLAEYNSLPISVMDELARLAMVLLNILANAAQAIEQRGTITIETRREEGWAVVAIGDTGRGIAPDVLGRVFDPFFTTKPVGEGTGLGLSISYEIAKKHGGDIGVESRPGHGATFTVRLPLGPRAADLTPAGRSQTGAGG